MIIPWQFDWKRLGDFPVTLGLCAVNILLFYLFFSSFVRPSQNSEIMTDERIAQTAIQYLYWKDPGSFSRRLGSMNTKELSTLGFEALRDIAFLGSLKEIKPWGNLVQFEDWKKVILDFRDQQEISPDHRFGLSHSSRYGLSWITYQFSHVNEMHLLTNLVFLFSLGVLIEGLFGGLALMLLYFFGGLVGGYFYLSLSAVSSIPVVGASASVSAIMAFVAISYGQKSLSYFVIPWKNFYGILYAPAYWIIPLYLIGDLASLLSYSPEWAGSVAHSAHLGGACFGLFMGLVAVLPSRLNPKTESY